ncbi:hypothetical protein J7E49_11100 [Variovorax paradoxus]|nr:hypothetical protein [Variovorax paradoxus]
MTRIRCTVLLCTLALGGCAAFDARSFDRSAGWRAAQVVSVGRAGDLAGLAERDCGAEGGAAAAYAIVRYRNGGVRSHSLGTGRWSPGAEPKVGDVLEVNILDCAAPLARADQSGSNSGAPLR